MILTFSTDYEYVGTGEFEIKWGSKQEIKKKVPRTVSAEYTAKTASYNAVKGLLSSFKEDEYELMFGDHARIVVLPNAVDVDTYEHD